MLLKLLTCIVDLKNKTSFYMQVCQIQWKMIKNFFKLKPDIKLTDMKIKIYRYNPVTLTVG